jgi:hypothetical protein
VGQRIDRAERVKIYAIATATYEVYGHGDTGIEPKIILWGSYGADGFPPCFVSSERAIEWLTAQKHPDGNIIVELDLVH